MMKEHRYSNEIKSIRLQTLRHVWRITQIQSELHFCAESPHNISYQLFQQTGNTRLSN